MTIEELCATVARMNVPQHKQDASKPTVCKWLLDNLYIRNGKHPQFVQVMRGLLVHATAQLWLKSKEIKMYEDYLSGFGANPQFPQPGGFIDEAHIKPSLQNIPKNSEFAKRVFTKEGAGVMQRIDTGREATVASTYVRGDQIRDPAASPPTAPFMHALERGLTGTGRISRSEPEMQELPRERDPAVKKIVAALKSERRPVLKMPTLGAPYGRPKAGKTVIGDEIAAALGFGPKKG